MIDNCEKDFVLYYVCTDLLCNTSHIKSDQRGPIHSIHFTMLCEVVIFVVNGYLTNLDKN